MAPYSPFAIPSLLSTVRSQLPSNIIIKHQQHNKRSGNPKSGCPTASLSLKPNRCYFLNFPSVAFLSFRSYVCSCAYVNVCVLVTVLVVTFFCALPYFRAGPLTWPATARKCFHSKANAIKKAIYQHKILYGMPLSWLIFSSYPLCVLIAAL